MRILFVSHSLPPDGRHLDNLGGIQRVALELQHALAAKDDVELVPLVLRSRWSQRHYRVPLFLASALRELNRHARTRDVDVVLLTSMVTGALAIATRRAFAEAGIPIAIIAYGHDVTMSFPPYQWLVPRIFAAGDAILPISGATAEACSARGVPADRLRVVHLGIDFDRFPPLATRTTMRAKLVESLGRDGPALPAGALLLCSVGRQITRKGFHWFAEHVMPMLPAHVHWWLAGNGPENGRIREAVARHQLQERVRLLGRLSDAEVTTLYRGSDLFVMPNVHVPGDMEGFGLVMLEAGACGLPVIASRLEGIADVIIEGENGHLVESAETSSFARAILAFDGDRSALAAASERARRHTLSRFGWDAAASRYVSVLRSLTAGEITSSAR